MAALLVVLAIMALLLSMALPVWGHAARREREAELIFRGEQYARAIMLYQRQLPGAWPPDIETLVEGRFLRRAYRDPMTPDGEFRLVPLSELAALAGPDGAGGGAEDPADDANRGPERRRSGGGRVGPGSGMGQFADRDGASSGRADGGIAGVVSRSDRASIARYKGRSRYSDWIFTPGAAADGGAGAPQPADAAAAGRGGAGGFPRRAGVQAR